MNKRIKKICLVTAALFPMALTGCVGSQGALTLDQQLNMIEKDIAGVFAPAEYTQPITLSDAMARAIKFNLDRRLAEQQEIVAQSDYELAKLNILPEIGVDASYTGRNSPGASASRSVSTGQTSLEPSISADQYRKTASLDASWNALDAGMDFVRSKQKQDEAYVAKERRRKVVHNIVQDVRYAYWRAVGSELLEQQASALQKKAQETIRYLQTAEALNLEDSETILQKQASLLESVHEMNRLKTELSFAKTELAALVNVPSSANLLINVESYSDIDFLSVPTFTLGANELESIALVMRPEMREEGYQQRIQNNAVKLAVMETFPGMELFTKANYDSNQFLEDQRWVNFSINLSQSLVKLFTLPARYEHEKSKVRAGELRRQALTAAVMTQTRIAMTRYTLAKDQFKLMKRINGVDERMADKARGQAYAEVISEPDLVLAEIRSLLSKTRAYLAYADMQNAYGRVINTTGLDPVSADLQNEQLHEIKVSIEHQLANQNKMIEDVYWAIYEKSGGVLAQKAQQISDYGSLKSYTEAVYNEAPAANDYDDGDNETNHSGFLSTPISSGYENGLPVPSKETLKQDISFENQKNNENSELPTIPQYTGPSQPILDGDPYLENITVPQSEIPPAQEVMVTPSKKPASYQEAKIVSASFSGDIRPSACDTYYDIKSGCLEH